MDTSSHPLPETFLQTLSLQQCPTEGPHLQFCPHPQALPSSPPPRVLPALLPQGPSSSLLPGFLQLSSPRVPPALAPAPRIPPAGLSLAPWGLVLYRSLCASCLQAVSQLYAPDTRLPSSSV